jgi:hypothetical protein
LGKLLKSLQYKRVPQNAESATANGVASAQVKAALDSSIGIGCGKQYVMVSTFKKSQSRNKRASRTEGIIRLLLIILWAVVIVVFGFYSGLAYHHH